MTGHRNIEQLFQYFKKASASLFYLMATVLFHNLGYISVKRESQWQVKKDHKQDLL